MKQRVVIKRLQDIPGSRKAYPQRYGEPKQQICFDNSIPLLSVVHITKNYRPPGNSPPLHSSLIVQRIRLFLCMIILSTTFNYDVSSSPIIMLFTEEQDSTPQLCTSTSSSIGILAYIIIDTNISRGLTSSPTIPSRVAFELRGLLQSYPAISPAHIHSIISSASSCLLCSSTNSISDIRPPSSLFFVNHRNYGFSPRQPHCLRGETRQYTTTLLPYILCIGTRLTRMSLIAEDDILRILTHQILLTIQCPLIIGIRTQRSPSPLFDIPSRTHPPISVPRYTHVDSHFNHLKS
ncbi:hypothetical protein FRC03_012376 [Tulasnella sp. 419]|nr:hypothetical protein FRC03_012376 [Tulasnella sp. 419]